jgi:quercetin dioxygenase-like cupin family protein
MLPLSLKRILGAWLHAASAFPLAPGAPARKTARGSPGEEVETLLATGQTLLGQTITYPAGAPAKVTADIICIDRGGQTGWHAHDVPLLAYMLEGELTVDYGPEGTHVYRAGDVIVEAIGTPHNGHNTGSGVVRMFAVFLGAEGVPDTIEAAPPKPHK